MEDFAEYRVDAAPYQETSLSKAELMAILKERAVRFSADGLNEQAESADREEMVVFSQYETQYAVPLEMLGEIRAITKLSTLPLVNPAILGVINVRGRIVPLYRLLDQTDAKDTLSTAIQGFALVGHSVATHLAIWAEDIVGTLKVKTSAIKAPPISLADRDYIRGVGSDGIVFLDLEKLVNNKKIYQA